MAPANVLSRGEGMGSRALRLAHTVRHLKREQIVGRVVNRLHRPRIDLSPAPSLRPTCGPWLPPVMKPRSLRDGGRSARFLNVTAPIAGAAAWNDPAQAKLWLYNLHYFDDLAGPSAPAAVHAAFISRWIAENPPTSGNGWEPYPVSLRIVNWIKWALAGHVLGDTMRHSLAVQVRWLMERIEWHLLGNHLLANAKALVFAGLYFGGDEAERWFEAGRRIYARELPEQILADGGHFELSPMYHAIIQDDLLDVWNVARRYGRAEVAPFASLVSIVPRMGRWLAAMTHPDGGPAFFNDSTFDIAPTTAELVAYTGRLGLPSVDAPGEGVHHLAATGYVRVNLGPAAAILDVAEVGPSYIPGHAHADTLSFELSLDGRRVIVNGGTSTYAPGPLREAERATRAHSTVGIDDRNSSDVWGAFRVGKRAHVFDVTVSATLDGVTVTGSHDGYRTRYGGPIHTRRWAISPGRLVVEDRLDGSRYGAAVARFHLSPTVSLRTADDGPMLHLIEAQRRDLAITADGELRSTSHAWGRAFGLAERAHSCEVAFRCSHICTRMIWN